MQRADLLQAAREAVCDRATAYGSPEQNFDRIAARWNVHLINAYPEAVTRPGLLTAADVAVMLLDVKLARIEADPKHADSWIDAAGYAACGGEVSGAEPPPVRRDFLRDCDPGDENDASSVVKCEFYPGQAVEVKFGTSWLSGTLDRRTTELGATCKTHWRVNVWRGPRLPLKHWTVDESRLRPRRVDLPCDVECSDSTRRFL